MIQFKIKWYLFIKKKSPSNEWKNKSKTIYLFISVFLIIIVSIFFFTEICLAWLLSTKNKVNLKVQLILETNMKFSVKFPLQISIFTSSYLSLFTYMYLHEYCQKKINLFFNQYFLLKNFVVMNQNTCNNYIDFSKL